MTIVVNAVLAFEEARGVGRYFNNLLPKLANVDKENEYYIYYGSWMKKYDFLKVKGKNIHFIELNIKNKQISRNMYLAFILPIVCRKYKPDIYFLIDTQATFIKPCKMLSTIHDLAEFQVPEKYSYMQAFIRRCIVKKQIKMSDQIITVSEYSKNDICQRFSIPQEKIHVIYNFVADSHKNDDELKQPESYFLFVSETEKAKNLEVLIRAFALLNQDIKKQYRIKVVGKKGNDYERLLRLISQLGMDDKVDFYGFVSDTELQELYAKAYVFVFPSFFEGFGLPVIEAMGNNTPVICSNVSSIPEVGGDAVLTFDPSNATELKQQIEYLINYPDKRVDMIYKGKEQLKRFDSAILINQFMDIIEKLKN